jgi:ubiquinone/menaquinone biosynthesis C-methylase UbiE
MDLTRWKENWEKLGEQDPMWAILSDPSKKGRKWDPVGFFQSGETDINRLLGEVKAVGFPLTPGTALDFGCGLGRLTQALCSHFDRCYGVDISSTMLAEANRYNRFGDACKYVLNAGSDLHCFVDNTFDFIYSHLVLQHIPPDAGAQYVLEFVRVLKPGGLLIFQAPSEQLPGAENSGESPTAGNSTGATKPAGTFSKVKDVWVRLKSAVRRDPSQSHSEGQALETLIDMYCLPREQVITLIDRAGGSLLQIQEYNSSGPKWSSFRYWVTKSSA